MRAPDPHQIPRLKHCMDPGSPVFALDPRWISSGFPVDHTAGAGEEGWEGGMGVGVWGEVASLVWMGRREGKEGRSWRGGEKKINKK